MALSASSGILKFSLCRKNEMGSFSSQWDMMNLRTDISNSPTLLLYNLLIFKACLKMLVRACCVRQRSNLGGHYFACGPELPIE